jgi:hypothetical protein
MMKKNYIFLFLIVLLGAIALYFITRPTDNTFSKSLHDFTIEDTASVTKIFIANKRDNTVLLERLNPGEWRLNGDFKASKASIDLVLKTLNQLTVREPVPAAAHDNIIKRLAATATKVEIYQRLPRIILFGKSFFVRETLSRVFYVGDATKDNLGTYMLRDGAEIPFIVYMPGLRGFVSTRFTAFEDDWRDHTIFNHQMSEIASVSIEFPDQQQQSFKINQTEGKFELIATEKNLRVDNYDTLALMSYLNSFGKIRFEALLNYMDSTFIDSVKHSLPAHIITLRGINGNEIKVKTYRKSGNEGQSDYDGNPLPYDMDRMFATIHDDKDFVLVQFFTFDRILRPLVFFLPKQSEKNK